MQGVYTFTNLTNFLAGNYSQFQQAFGAPSQRQKNQNFGVFVRDEWKPSRNVTLNIGLRYDLQFLPDSIKTDIERMSPLRFNESSVVRVSRLAKTEFTSSETEKLSFGEICNSSEVFTNGI